MGANFKYHNYIPCICLWIASTVAVLAPLTFSAFAQQEEASFKPFATGVQSENKSEHDISLQLNDSQIVKLTPKLIDSLAAQLGLPRDSQILKNLTDAYEQAKYRAVTAPPKEIDFPTYNTGPDPDEEYEHPNILKHFRGKDGIPFLAKDDVPLPFSVSVDDIKQMMEQHFDLMHDSVEKNITPQIIPKCLKDQTTREETGFPLNEKADELLADMLFMDEKDVPLDAEEVFGANVAVVGLPANESSLLSIPAIGVGVNCLPFRWRVTRKYMLNHTGKHALKNYDKNILGEGEFSEYMKVKLGLSK